MDQASLPWITSTHPDTLKAVIFEAGEDMSHSLQYQFRYDKSIRKWLIRFIRSIVILALPPTWCFYLKFSEKYPIYS